MLIEDLVEFGLSDKEARVYLSLLELETATVGEIAKKSGINRSSTYVVLDSLQKQGLVGTTGDKSVLHYFTTSPDFLLKTAEDLAKKQEEIRKRIDKMIPELNALHKDTKIKPRVKVFEGKQGLINAYEDCLSSKEKLIRVSSSVGNLFNILSDYFPNFLIRRRKLGIKMNSIHPNDSLNQHLLTIKPVDFDTPVLIPNEKYKFPADLVIYDNKIGYSSAEKGGFAIIIESSEMADAMKTVFDLAFEEAKRLNKTIKPDTKPSKN